MSQLESRDDRETAVDFHKSRVTNHESNLLLGVDADVVDKHLLREDRGAVGRAGPGAAYGDIEKDEERMIENPGAAGGPLGLRKRGVKIRVHVKADYSRLPFDGVEMKVIRECLTAWKAERS